MFIFIQGHCPGACGLARRAREVKKSLPLLTQHSLTQLWIWSSGFLLNKAWNNLGFAFVYIPYQWGPWDMERSQSGIKTFKVSVYHLPKEIEDLASLSLQQHKEEAGRSGRGLFQQQENSMLETTSVHSCPGARDKKQLPKHTKRDTSSSGCEMKQTKARIWIPLNTGNVLIHFKISSINLRNPCFWLYCSAAD